ncbi:hypothetical protein BELL_0351g00040 [Botrytis elliptica]|uniref:Carrier domain-containing protein n=1 Tax=Botrytis elliptica TaxID=278938 RepID=A0A4Z1JJQ5_9HELO|nr:hypothetical protein BELL_0351g00040 [Botrytis elliptica]
MPLECKDAEIAAMEPIAIVGMACRLPGEVDSASSLWDMLVHRRSAQAARVPKSRFDIDAYYHENLERPGSFNVLGGYFLDGAAEDFDPSFFGISPIESMWMDPQQRKILEVAYECFESAGLTLEELSGSNTAVFIGSFTADYQQISFRETDFRHSYSATGVDPGLISNRVGNTFNLQGPSFTINTACSSSIYAIHNACHALRSRDCVAALAGGVNIILTVDQHMNTAKLGVLSPTSTCRTFDASADGYGRAEGVGVLNGKVPGMGITYPSVKGQERVMRAAYEKANLDPSQTLYLEMHGTGTPTGDPIEAKAVSNAMNDNRSKNAPLFVGAIKPNIGHSEAASGVFSVMKAAMMTEAGIIPGVCGFQKINPEIKEKEWNIKVHAETKPWPDNHSVRRASVNSFGYGGTNGHVIIEGIQSLYPSYQHGVAKTESPVDKSTSRPILVPFSAHDKTTLLRNIEAHSKVVDDFYIIDLAHTLNSRSKFNHRAFTITSDLEHDDKFSSGSFKLGAAPSIEPQFMFIFTGQGAQWPRMASQAMKTFPSFLDTIRSLDDILQRLDPPACWKIEDVLLDTAETSRLNDAEISQPVCTGIQIALVNLMAKWGILPTVTVGHSSGEIAAAYAAGLISAGDAIISAFYRGYTVKRSAVCGTMLAVGLGAEHVNKYIQDTSDVVIACINSSRSTTLSGSVSGIQEVKNQLDAEKIFARELDTGKAYHSPYMDAVAPEYEKLYNLATTRLENHTSNKRLPRARMISSVTGREILEDTLSIKYWCENLRGKVKFEQAVSAVLETTGLEKVTCAIEVGPHAALSGPFKQILQYLGIERFNYIPTLVRKTDDSIQLLKLAGELFLLGASININLVNCIGNANAASSTPQFLVDLPPYQWNYKKTYWAEPSMSRAQRCKSFLRHDLLGSRIVGLSGLVWQNKLRLKDIPWLFDHNLGGSVVFPAAGYLSMAVEALRQVLDSTMLNIRYQGVRFRDTSFKLAMVIPDTDDGLEVQLRLQPVTKSSKEIEAIWYGFVVESFAEGRWQTHSEGMIAANPTPRADTSFNEPPTSHNKMTQSTSSKRWYSSFSRVGFNYGPSFQGLHNIIAAKGIKEATADVDLTTKSGLMTGESRYILHPSSIDACLQLMIISLNEGLYKSMQFGCVPIKIEEISLWFPETDIESRGKAVAWSETFGRYANNSAQLKGKSGEIILDIRDLRTVTYEAAAPPQAEIEKVRPKPYMGVVWKPDIAHLVPEYLRPTSKDTPITTTAGTGLELITKIVDLANHKSPLERVLLLGQYTVLFVKTLLEILSSTASCTICSIDPDQDGELKRLSSIDNRITSIFVPNVTLLGSTPSIPTSQDLVVVSKELSDEAANDVILLARSIRNDKGYAIFHTSIPFGISLEKALCVHDHESRNLRFGPFDSAVILSCPGDQKFRMNGGVMHKNKATVLSLKGQSTLMMKTTEKFLEHQWHVECKELGNFDAIGDSNLIVDDIDGNFLSSLDKSSFESLKKLLCSGIPILWLTAGVNEGKLIGGSLAVGLIRAILAERASTKITILDVDLGEHPTSIMNAIVSTIPKKESGSADEETEFWLQNGSIHISRLVPHYRLNNILAKSFETTRTLLTTGRTLQGSVVDGKLFFNEENLSEQDELADNEVEMQVFASEVNSADVQFQSQRARLIAGKIVATGKGLNNSLLGQNIVTYTHKAFSTLVRVSYLDTQPVNMCADDIVAILPSLCHVWNAVVNSAQAKKDHHILLLPAPASFVKAFTSISKAIGYTYTLIVGSVEDEKKCLELGISEAELIRSSTTDVPLALKRLISKKRLASIISHEFSSLSQEIWRHVPPGTIFVLSNGTILEPPDALPFTRGATFLSTSIDMLYKQDKTSIGSILTGAIDHLKNHSDILHQRTKKYSIQELSNAGMASTNLTSIEEATITYGYGEDFIEVQNSTKLRFNSSASYILVGCLGGLGRSLTIWMMRRGARHFAFVSRSGLDKLEAAQLVKSLRKEGASVNVYRADAANEKDLSSVIAQESSERPIRGVVHAAMVLNDSLFEKMSYDQFKGTIDPKVKVAENLHRGLIGHCLDFFLMLSSISATLGNPGQSNYSAGNCYLDSLAWGRNVQGLPAVSVVLPAILDVGYVSEHQEIEVLLSRRGIFGINEDEMICGFETAIKDQPSAGNAILQDSQIVLGLDPSTVASALSSIHTTDVFWFENPRFRHLRAEIREVVGSGGNSGTKSSSGNTIEQIQAAITAGPEHVINIISAQVAKKLSNILAISIEDMPLEGTSVASFGLDSMIGAEFRNWLFKEFGYEVPFPILLAPDLSIKDLSVNVGIKLGVLRSEIDM